MKNSQSNLATVVVSEKPTAKQRVQGASISVVEAIVYPAHLVCQTAADLLNIGQAKAINLIDGTPMYESMHNQQEWTQAQQAKVVNAYLKVKERIDKQREYNRQLDIAKTKAVLDKLEGVEAVVVPTPPTTESSYPITKFKKIVQNSEVPLMSPNAVFTVEQ